MTDAEFRRLYEEADTAAAALEAAIKKLPRYRRIRNLPEYAVFLEKARAFREAARAREAKALARAGL